MRTVFVILSFFLSFIPSLYPIKYAFSIVYNYVFREVGQKINDWLHKKGEENGVHKASVIRPVGNKSVENVHQKLPVKLFSTERISIHLCTDERASVCAMVLFISPSRALSFSLSLNNFMLIT